MDALTLVFVGLLLAAAIILTLTVRSQILRAAEAKRDQQHQLEEAMRRQQSRHGNPRSATRR